jgi:hypothetical protein
MIRRKPKSGKIYLSSVTVAVAALNLGTVCANTRSIAKVTNSRAGCNVRSALEWFYTSLRAVGARHLLNSMLDTLRGRICMRLRLSL